MGVSTREVEGTQDGKGDKEARIITKIYLVRNDHNVI